MSGTALHNADIDAALTEAKEAYVARNPKSFSRYVEATAVMPGGNTRTVLFYAPVPARHGTRRGLPAVGHGRRGIRRLPGRIHRRDLRPLASGDPRRGGPRAGQRHQHGGAQPAGGEVRPRGVRPLRAGAGALHQFRHRGQPAGASPWRACSPGAARCWCSTAATMARCSASPAAAVAGERAVRLRAGALQRYRRHPRADRASTPPTWRR